MLSLELGQSNPLHLLWPVSLLVPFNCNRGNRLSYSVRARSGWGDSFIRHNNLI